MLHQEIGRKNNYCLFITFVPLKWLSWDSGLSDLVLEDIEWIDNCLVFIFIFCAIANDCEGRKRRAGRRLPSRQPGRWTCLPTHLIRRYGMEQNTWGEARGAKSAPMWRGNAAECAKAVYRRDAGGNGLRYTLARLTIGIQTWGAKVYRARITEKLLFWQNIISDEFDSAVNLWKLFLRKSVASLSVLRSSIGNFLFPVKIEYLINEKDWKHDYRSVYLKLLLVGIQFPKKLF